MSAPQEAQRRIFRKIDYLVVINPPVMGRKRKKRFARHLSQFQGRLPPVKYIGVNKNHLDMRNWENFSLLRDKRGLFVRLKLKIGWEKNAIDFASRYGAFFQPLHMYPRYSLVRRSRRRVWHWYVGVTGCFLSHIEAWRFIGASAGIQGLYLERYGPFYEPDNWNPVAWYGTNVRE